MAGGVCIERVWFCTPAQAALIMMVNKVTLNFCLARRQQEMVTRRRKRKSRLLPVQDSRYCRDSILYRCGVGVVRPPQRGQSDLCFLSLSRVLCPASCPFFFFWLSFSQLSALILRRSPANRILFALRQDKHCPCVTPKTFHRLSHFQHGSDISIIGFFLLLKCSEETMRVKRKNKRAMRRSPNKGQVPFPPETHQNMSGKAPPHGLFLSYSAVQYRDQNGDRTKIGWTPHSSWSKAKRGQKSS